MEKFNIFVGDLSFFCTEADLERLFSTIGEVRGTIIRRGKQGDTLHYGFVNMSDEDAVKAVNHLQGQTFMARRLRLNIESMEDGPKMRGKDMQSFPQVHVSFLSTSIRSQVNEDLLARLFSRFGTIIDCIVKQYRLTINPHRQSGYGFVFYCTEEDAWRAINAVKNSTIDGIKFDCSFSREYQPSSNSNNHNNYKTDNTFASIPSTTQSNPQYSPTYRIPQSSIVPPISSGSAAHIDSSYSSQQPYYQSPSIPTFSQQSQYLPNSNVNSRNSLSSAVTSVFLQQHPQHSANNVTALIPASTPTTSYVNYSHPQPHSAPPAAHHLANMLTSNSLITPMHPTLVPSHNMYFNSNNNQFIYSNFAPDHTAATSSNNMVPSLLSVPTTQYPAGVYSNQFPLSHPYYTFR